MTRMMMQMVLLSKAFQGIRPFAKEEIKPYIRYQLKEVIGIQSLRYISSTCTNYDEKNDDLKTQTTSTNQENLMDDHESDDEDVVVLGPAGLEYGGPQRGGKYKEPTRYGDWEQKGRCTDF